VIWKSNARRSATSTWAMSTLIRVMRKRDEQNEKLRDFSDYLHGLHEYLLCLMRKKSRWDSFDIVDGKEELEKVEDEDKMGHSDGQVIFNLLCCQASEDYRVPLS